MSSAERWFGDAFAHLHPLIQALHRSGGEIGGTISIETGTGLAGLVGQRLARRLGMPPRGTASLHVHVIHGDGEMRWVRTVNGAGRFTSCFQPVGRFPDGYWREASWPVELRLGVTIANGGWRWQQREIRVAGLRLPAWLAPRAVPFKEIRDGRYYFRVEIALPWLGTVLTYGGLLDAVRTGA
jgi:hypothetical protein